MSREELLSYIERAPRNTSLTITKRRPDSCLLPIESYGAQRDIETSQWDYKLEVATSVLRHELHKRTVHCAAALTRMSVGPKGSHLFIAPTCEYLGAMAIFDEYNVLEM
jgi:hypothetical protein